MRVSEVMELTGLERSTAHRMLTVLAEENFAEKEEKSHRYRLGLETMRLGFASLRRAPLIEHYGAVVKRLARIAEDTVFLIARQGDYTVCLLREDGRFPIKIYSTNVGDIRPLGIGVGGMAMLATVPDREVDRIYQHHTKAFQAAGLSRHQIARVIARARSNGYVELVDTVTAGVGGVGAVIPHNGVAFAAVSIAAIKPRLTTARRAELGRLLLDAFGSRKHAGAR